MFYLRTFTSLVFLLIGPLAFSQINFSVIPVSCPGAIDGSATAFPQGGQGVYDYIWSTSDTLPQISTLSGGFYSVTVSDRFGWTANDSVWVHEPAPWNIQDSIIHESCPGTADGSIGLIVAGGTAPYTLLWSTGDGVPNLTGLTAGNYGITVTDTLGCQWTDTLSLINLSGMLTASAGADTTLCQDTYTLTATPPTFGLGTWSVASGSATFSNTHDPNASISGLSQGFNYLTWVVGAGVCADVDTVNIYLSAAAFTDAGSDTSLCGSGALLQAEAPLSGSGSWTGNGQIISPSDAWTVVTGLQPGANLFVWTVSDEGCTASDTVQVQIFPEAVADFNFNAINLTVDFNDQSTGAGSWWWDFGDGQNSTAANPVHSFSQPGTYWVCLTVMDSCGTDTYCDSVLLNCLAPAANFSHTANGLSFNFQNNSQSANLNPNWHWDFGDGDTSILENPVHTYLSNGTYTICLTVSDSCGSHTICDTIIVNCQAPSASFTYLSLGFLTLDFFSQSSSSTNQSFNWDFGDGNSSNLENPTHTYAFDGFYNICLTVEDSCGKDSFCQNIQVLIPVNLEEGEKELIVFPNPFHNQVKILGKGLEYESLNWSLMDVQGRVILAGEIKTESGKLEESLKLELLPKGVYLLSLVSEKGRIVKKLVK